MDILFKSAATGVVESVDYDEFKDRIRQGKIIPLDKVRDPILTNDEWRTVDTLNIFRSLSPSTRATWTLHRDRARQEAQRREEAARRSLDREQQLAANFFQCEEPLGNYDLIHFHQFLVECQKQPLAQDEAAVRFTYLHSWGSAFFVRISNCTRVWEMELQGG